MNFHARMSELARTYDTSPGRALELAAALEQELVAADPVDPRQLGWVRDYRVRCLYRLGRHAEGLMALMAPPRQPIASSPGNTAWLYGLGAEMALHVGGPRLGLVMLGKALELRVAAGDPLQVRAAVEAGFALLRRAGDPLALYTWYLTVEAYTAAAIPRAAAEALARCLAEASREQGRAAA
jgi:hypothetical protein